MLTTTVLAAQIALAAVAPSTHPRTLGWWDKPGLVAVEITHSKPQRPSRLELYATVGAGFAADYTSTLAFVRAINRTGGCGWCHETNSLPGIRSPLGALAWQIGGTVALSEVLYWAGGKLPAYARWVARLVTGYRLYIAGGNIRFALSW